MNNTRQGYIKITRPVYHTEYYHDEFEYEEPERNLKRMIKEKFRCRPKQCLMNFIPILHWLPRYKWKTDLLQDIIAGFTVAIMHIPQGMAYALLGNCPPIVGIYTAFFPVLIYFFFGTSRHNSMGTFAIVCLMVGKVVNEKAVGDVTAVDIATALAFVSGVTQLFMYLLRLGIVSCLLCDSLVNGFTTGAAVHVLMSQIKDLLGLKLPRIEGMFPVIMTLVNIFKYIHTFNYVALIISTITITICVLNNELVKPRLAKITVFPIPIELIMVLTGTLISKYFYLHEDFNLAIVGSIPSGLPVPRVPHFNVVVNTILDGIIIAVVSYAISISMGMIFAQKLNYQIEANQELFAQGFGNVFGSFFSCMPFAASLSRSLIQQTVGGKTQLTSIISCIILVFVLLFIGPFFESLPKAVLAGVIVVALKGMFVQARMVKVFWRTSKLDVIIWTVTFLAVVLLDVDIGLLVGLIVAILTILFLGMKPYNCIMGHVPGTELYVDINKYARAEQIDNVRIYHYCGGISFATRNCFRDELYKKVNIDPKKEYLRLVKEREATNLMGKDNIGYEHSPYDVESTGPFQTKMKYLILDLSAISFIDPSAIETIRILQQDFKKINVAVLLAACPDHVYDMMKRCDLFKNDEDLFKVFPTVHDAVQSTNRN